MDTGDESVRRQEQETDIALRQARAAAASLPEPTGVCLNCCDAVPDGHRWCDADCRDDWERINGRA